MGQIADYFPHTFSSRSLYQQVYLSSRMVRLFADRHLMTSFAGAQSGRKPSGTGSNDHDAFGRNISDFIDSMFFKTDFRVLDAGQGFGLVYATDAALVVPHAIVNIFGFVLPWPFWANPDHKSDYE